MSSLLDIIKSRRSVRIFETKSVPDDALRVLLEGAIWAPSGSNVQPWFFGVIRDPAKIRNISSFSPGLGGTPPLLLILCIDKATALKKGGEFGRDELSVVDVSLAAQNILLLAQDMGLGACVVKSFNPQGVARLLKLPEHIKPELIITVGYPARAPAASRRTPVCDVTFYDEWEA